MYTDTITTEKERAVGLARKGLDTITIRLSPRDDVERVVRRDVLPVCNVSPQDLNDIVEVLFPYACERTYGVRR